MTAFIGGGSGPRSKDIIQRRRSSCPPLEKGDEGGLRLCRLTASGPGLSALFHFAKKNSLENLDSLRYSSNFIIFYFNNYTSYAVDLVPTRRGNVLRPFHGGTRSVRAAFPRGAWERETATA